MVRVTSDQQKVGLIVTAYVVGLLATLGIGVLVDFTLGAVVALVLTVVAVVVFTRIFRGDNEELAPPRPLWRMTARPTSGYVFAALFGLQAVTHPTPQNGMLWLAATGVIVDVAIAALFLASSLRLRRLTRERGPHGPQS